MPIGTQAAELLDTRQHDEEEVGTLDDENSDDNTEDSETAPSSLRTEDEFRKRASEVYATYETKYRKRFHWLSSHLFNETLAKSLLADSHNLLKVLAKCDTWESSKDAKLLRLRKLLASERPNDKVLIFTQFADTARYLYDELRQRGIKSIGCATAAVRRM